MYFVVFVPCYLCLLYGSEINLKVKSNQPDLGVIMVINLVYDIARTAEPQFLKTIYL